VGPSVALATRKPGAGEPWCRAARRGLSRNGSVQQVSGKRATMRRGHECEVRPRKVTAANSASPARTIRGIGHALRPKDECWALACPPRTSWHARFPPHDAEGYDGAGRVVAPSTQFARHGGGRIESRGPGGGRVEVECLHSGKLASQRISWCRRLLTHVRSSPRTHAADAR